MGALSDIASKDHENKPNNPSKKIEPDPKGIEIYGTYIHDSLPFVGKSGKGRKSIS
jgi:hypothetical protein